MTEELLSVVIPTRNRAGLLRAAIASVLQSPLVKSPNQVIVVDDGSTDDTPTVLAEAGVRTVTVNNAGPAGARNAGLALVGTEFVAFLDDDDLWLPGNMEQQVQALIDNPPAAFAFGRVQRTDPELVPFGEPFPPMPPPGMDLRLHVYSHFFQVGAIAFRVSTLRQHGAFDTTVGRLEDWDLLNRLAAAHPVIPVDVVGSLFRQRHANRQDAEIRWSTHQEWLRNIRKLSRSGSIPPYRQRFMTDLRVRGLTVYYFCEDANAALDEGRSKAALRYLSRAMRVSPIHAAVKPRFWRALFDATFPRSLRRRISAR